MYGACIEENRSLRYADEERDRHYAETDEDRWYKGADESRQWTLVHLFGRNARRESVAAAFRELAERWRKDTIFTSSITEQLRHPSYRQIVLMGQAALPLILRDLQQTHFYWFPVLAAITQESPVAPHDIGDVAKMSEAWLEWGRKRGLI